MHEENRKNWVRLTEENFDKILVGTKLAGESPVVWPHIVIKKSGENLTIEAAAKDDKQIYTLKGEKTKSKLIADGWFVQL